MWLKGCNILTNVFSVSLETFFPGEKNKDGGGGGEEEEGSKGSSASLWES